MSLIPRALRRGPWRDLPDIDVAHTIGVAVFVAVASGGLVCVGYFAWALCFAVRVPTAPRSARSVLVFGKRLVDGAVDADFLGRIGRAHEIACARRCDRILLLGGARPGERSEAASAFAELERLGVPAEVEVLVEEHSKDTLENLRNARTLLGAGAREPVALLSSRYHLARIAFLARRLGFDGEACAAESHFSPTFAHLRRIALEAAYVYWADIGLRWARLIGHRRLLAALA